jgi:hypothetical protein
MKILNLKLAVVMAALSSTPTFAEEAPDGTEIYIEDLSYGGTGCQADTVSWNLSDDGKAVTVIYDEFFVETDENARRTGKNCSLKLDLNVPPGYSFSIFNVDIRGYASLDEGTVGRQAVRYGITGRQNPGAGRGRGRGRGGRGAGAGSVLMGEMVLNGLFDDDYEQNLVLPARSLVWSPCAQDKIKNVTLTTNIAVRKKDLGASGYIAVDSLDGELNHEFGIKWRKCSGMGPVRPNPRAERPNPRGKNFGGKKFANHRPGRPGQGGRPGNGNGGRPGNGNGNGGRPGNGNGGDVGNGGGGNGNGHGPGPGHGPGGAAEPDYSGFSSTKSLTLPNGRRPISCSVEWRSDPKGALNESKNTCDSMAQSLPRFLKKLYEVRMKILDVQVKQEFAQWKKRQ